MVRPVNTFHRAVRMVEIAAVAVLSIFALKTYLELSSLRKAPVVLPNYQFEVLGNGSISTRGTWVSDKGPPEPLVTTTIECHKARMECIESAALVVFVSGKGLLESQHTVFPVERWTEADIVTKATPGRCFERKLLFDLKEKRATSQATASEEKGLCREIPARTLELVTGYRAR